MNIPKQNMHFRKKILVLSVLLAVGAAHAEDEDVEQLTKNESTVSVGVGGYIGAYSDKSIFSQYNGLNKNSNLLLDLNVTKLNDEKGLWTKFEGHNLGLDNREFSFSQNKQGDWKYSLEYNEITHHDIRTLNSAVQGAGTTTPSVNIATPATNPINALNLQLQRQAETLGAEKWITPHLLFEAVFKNEDKTGARMSGEGIFCGGSRFAACGNSGAVLMLPEPVNTNTKQIDAKLNFSGDKFLLSGGYYGAFFTNANGSINPTVNGSLYAANTNTLANYMAAPIALQPNSDAQKLFLSGNYAFTPTTRSTFKYAYTHATQNESYGSMGLSGPALGPSAGVNSLGGVVDTNLVQFGLTSRPMTKLNLLANVQYEDKNDKTPNGSYNVLNSPFNPAPATAYYSNNYSNSSKKVNGKLEASYQLPDNYRATLGMDYATVQRATPPTSLGAATDLAKALGGLRANTNETSYRAELRRSLSDTANGALSYVNSRRSGDSWTFYGANGATSSQPLNTTSGTLPMMMMDRNRDKLAFSTDWTPTRKLTLQLNLENSKDTYTGPVEVGMRDSSTKTYSLDATLVLSESWKLTGYVSQSDQVMHVNHATTYQADLEDINTSLGLGVVGTPTSKLSVGGNLSYMDDQNHYNQTGGALPDVLYRVTSLKLFGKYSMQKNADVRVDLVHQSATLNEWTWQNFTYSDNSSVSMQPNQSVNFLGASYVYKFR